jgi:hypothetical protein
MGSGDMGSSDTGSRATWVRAKRNLRVNTARKSRIKASPLWRLLAGHRPEQSRPGAVGILPDAKSCPLNTLGLGAGGLGSMTLRPGSFSRVPIAPSDKAWFQAVSFEHCEVVHVQSAQTLDINFRSFKLVVAVAVDSVRGAALGAVLQSA